MSDPRAFMRASTSDDEKMEKFGSYRLREIGQVHRRPSVLHREHTGLEPGVRIPWTTLNHSSERLPNFVTLIEQNFVSPGFIAFGEVRAHRICRTHTNGSPEGVRLYTFCFLLRQPLQAARPRGVDISLALNSGWS